MTKAEKKDIAEKFSAWVKARREATEFTTLGMVEKEVYKLLGLICANGQLKEDR